MPQKILVVDDDPAISEMLTIVLSAEGFDTVAVTDGALAVETAEREQPDLILLDLMLPGMNGIDICRAIRQDSAVPIIMLTAKTDTVDVVLGLESGADDYVNKPFKAKELVARIRARLRRTDDEPAETLEVGDLTIDVPGTPSSVVMRRSPSPRWSLICCWNWRVNRSRYSPGRNSSVRCGATDMPPTPVWSMSTCSVCAPRLRRTRRTRRSFSRFVVSDTRPVMPNNAHHR